MSKDNTTAVASSKSLLKRLDSDMLRFHHQMEILRILFKNLEGSWLAVSLAHSASSEGWFVQQESVLSG